MSRDDACRRYYYDNKRKKLNKLLNIPRRRMRQFSLRGRYLVVSALVVVLIFALAWSARIYVDSAIESGSENIKSRNTASHHIRLLRDAVIGLEKDLEGFMLSPSAPQREAVNEAMLSALRHHRLLGQTEWAVGNSTVNEQLLAIGSQLDALEPAVNRLMDQRSDAYLQFPVLGILNDSVFDNQSSFASALQLAEHDSGQLPNTERKRLLRLHLKDLSRSWERLQAEFYLYLVNRVGEFNSEGLPQQINDIRIHYQASMEYLQQLQSYLQQQNLIDDFDEQLKTLHSSAGGWYQGFQEIVKLSDDGITRTDAPFMKHVIHPIFESVWNRLTLLDSMIEAEGTDDLNSVTHVAGTIASGLWALAFTGLLLVIIGYIYFEKVVLKPITLLAGALKAEAVGLRSVPMPTSRTQETQRLLDAFTEMRQQIKERQRALEHQNLHDNLTGLANRFLLHDRLRQAIIRAHRDGGYVGLLVLNIDQFKEINDSLGHHVGDGMLLQLCERLAQPFDETATLARLSADEFAVLLPATGSASMAVLTQKLIKLMETPFEVDQHSLFVGLSIGYAVYPNHGADATELLQHADVAMQHAKRRKSGVEVYDETQDSDHHRRFEIANELRQSMADRKQFHLVYQPQVALNTGNYYGMEVLLRWRHPEQGQISPDEFVTIAEQTGLMRPLTTMLLDMVMEQCRDWKSRNLDPGRVAVNLSVHNLEDPEFIDQLQALQQKWQLNPRTLAFEVTESAMMADPVNAQQTLEKITELGFEVAIDDFGTGFSSLAYLKRLPVSKLKIDKSFISDMHIDENDAVIVRSTVDMAHNMGLEVVAEGVDNREVLELLSILDCDYAQGYLLSKPMRAEKIEDWISGRMVYAMRPKASFA